MFQDFDTYVANVRWVLLLGVPLVVLVVAGASWWLSGLYEIRYCLLQMFDLETWGRCIGLPEGSPCLPRTQSPKTVKCKKSTLVRSPRLPNV